MDDLRYFLLGPVEVRTTSGRVSPGGPVATTLLAGLLLNANRTMPADRLAELLWGTSEVKADRIYVAVARLRRLLRDAFLDDEDVIVRKGAGYLMRVPPHQLDLGVFEASVTAARRVLCQGRSELARDMLQEALALWRNPVLDGALEPLAGSERPRLEELWLGAVEDRIEADLALGRAGNLIGELRGLVPAHPLRDRLRGQLMLALHRSGRKAEALAVYENGRGLLSEEFGLDPGPALRQLHVSILRDDPTLDARPTGAISGATGRGRRPAGLPPDVADFTGRLADLAHLDERSQPTPNSTAVQVTVIAGAAGVGKTALAVHWGHRRTDRFPDGQLYINLRGYDPGQQPTRALQALARLLRALGVAPERIPVDIDEAVESYRSLLAGRRMLVLLDNASSAEQVRPLLPGNAGCVVLVTSRDRLAGLTARDGARALALAPLHPAEARSLLTRIIGEDRARAEPDALGSLATACDRLPLALRITAANLTARPRLSIAEHVSELAHGDRIGALSVPGDPSSAVRSAFDQSYATLSVPERRLFRRLGLIPGPDFTTDVAAALADVDRATATGLLNRLADAHLVNRPAPGRYAQHDLIQAYAGDLCITEDTARDQRCAAERLLDLYLRHTISAAELQHPQMPPCPPAGEGGSQPTLFPDPAASLRWLDAERPNLVAATVHTAERGPYRYAWELAYYLRNYFTLGTHTVDALTVADAAQAAADRADDAYGRVSAVILHGLTHVRTSRHAEGIVHLQRAVDLSRMVGCFDEEGAAEGYLGIAYYESGQFQQATQHYRRAAAINEHSGRWGRLASNLNGLAGVLFELGELPAAEQHLTRALALHRNAGSAAAMGVALSNLGVVEHMLGRFDLALEHLTDGLTIYRELGDTRDALTLDTIAVVHRDAGRYALALERAEEAHTVAVEFGLLYPEATALNTLGTIHHRLAQYPLALNRHTEALAAARSAGLPQPEIDALIGLSVTAHGHGQPDQAADLARQAITLAQRRGFRLLEGVARAALAQARLSTGDPTAAAAEAQAAADIHRLAGHRLGQARALITLGHAVGSAAACEHWHSAQEVLTGIDVPELDQLRKLLGPH